MLFPFDKSFFLFVSSQVLISEVVPKQKVFTTWARHYWKDAFESSFPFFFLLLPPFSAFFTSCLFFPPPSSPSGFFSSFECVLPSEFAGDSFDLPPFLFLPYDKSCLLPVCFFSYLYD